MDSISTPWYMAESTFKFMDIYGIEYWVDLLLYGDSEGLTLVLVVGHEPIICPLL